MRPRRFGPVAALTVVGVMLTGSMAFAAELEDGDYTLTLPGVGNFIFTIDSDGPDETVVAVAPIPDGYVIDDNDPDKVAWKDIATLTLEVEAKTAKVEGDYDWLDEFLKPADAVLSLPGGSIIVTQPVDGNFTVSATGVWSAFGGGHDWYVANHADISKATAFFKVEATADGLEIKAVDEPDAGFLKELAEADEDAAEAAAEAAEEAAEAAADLAEKAAEAAEDDD